MKRLLVIIFIAASLHANSQLSKGTWLFGGSGEFYGYTQDYATPTYTIKYKYTDIGISASAGYFFAPKIAAGIRPVFSMFKGHWISATGGVGGGSANTKRYGAGPFVRYYFLNADKPFNILGDVCYQLGQLNFSGDKGKMNAFSAKAGPVIFFNSSVALEVLLGYSNRIEDMKDRFSDKRNGFQVSVGFQVHLER